MHTIPQAEETTRTTGDPMNELARTKDDLAREFKTLISEGEELMRQTSSLSGDALQVARDRFKARLATARSQVADLGSRARETGVDAARVADDYVHESPWVSVGAAAGFGFIVGLLLARRW
jgi:ElaB/YqjD/DUF883 family membrane-anchored ribosome-binding protein